MHKAYLRKQYLTESGQLSSVMLRDMGLRRHVY